MANFNKVMLIGNLTRDPQVKTIPGGTVVAEFGLAVNRTWTKDGEKKEEVCFVDCSAFGKQAETIGQWCQKGRPLFIEGRLKLDTWEDKQGGGKRSKLTVVVEGFQFLGGRDQAEGSTATPAATQRHPVTTEAARPGSPFEGAPDAFREADIPF